MKNVNCYAAVSSFLNHLEKKNTPALSICIYNVLNFLPNVVDLHAKVFMRLHM